MKISLTLHKMKKTQILSLVVLIVGLFLSYLSFNEIRPGPNEPITGVHITPGPGFPFWVPLQFDVWPVPTYLLGYLILGVILSTIGAFSLFIDHYISLAKD